MKARNIVGAPVGRAGRDAREQPADAQRALDRRHLGGVRAQRGHPVDDVAEGAQRHRLLAEAGQHSFDVRGVRGRRADDEDPAVLEAATLGVEQVRGPVQRDDGLARARTAGDLGDAAGGGADRLVLVALDGRDDVAHLPAAAAGERRHQGAVPDDDDVLRRLGHHEVVLDADDARPAAAQDATPDDPHRFDRGGPVEGSRGRRPPVDDERLVLVVAHPEPADVPDLPLGRRGVLGAEVEAAEDEALVLGVDGRPAPGCCEHEGVALEEAGHLLVADVAGAVGAPAREPVRLDVGRPEAGLLELRVDPVDVRLLDGDLGGDLGRGLGGAGVVGGHGRAVSWLVGAGHGTHQSRPAPVRRGPRSVYSGHGRRGAPDVEGRGEVQTWPGVSLIDL